MVLVAPLAQIDLSANNVQARLAETATSVLTFAQLAFSTNAGIWRNRYDLFLSLVIRAAMLGMSLTLKVAFLQLRTQTAESGLERLRSRLAAAGWSHR
jgi:hypothetical protein